MRVKSHTGREAVVTVFGLSWNKPPPGILQEAVSTKTCAINLVDIDKFLPKELDLATLSRGTRFNPPYPDTHDGGNTTAQAPQDSPSRNRPPAKVEASTPQRRTTQGSRCNPSSLPTASPQWSRQLELRHILTDPLSKAVTFSHQRLSSNQKQPCQRPYYTGLTKLWKPSATFHPTRQNTGYDPWMTSSSSCLWMKNTTS